MSYTLTDFLNSFQKLNDLYERDPSMQIPFELRNIIEESTEIFNLGARDEGELLMEKLDGEMEKVDELLIEIEHLVEERDHLEIEKKKAENHIFMIQDDCKECKIYKENEEMQEKHIEYLKSEIELYTRDVKSLTEDLDILRSNLEKKEEEKQVVEEKEIEAKNESERTKDKLKTLQLSNALLKRLNGAMNDIDKKNKNRVRELEEKNHSISQLNMEICEKMSQIKTEHGKQLEILHEQNTALKEEIESNQLEIRKAQFKLQALNSRTVSVISDNNFNNDIVSQDRMTVIHKDFDAISHSQLDVASKIDFQDDQTSIFSGGESRVSSVKDSKKKFNFGYSQKRKVRKRMNYSFNSPGSLDESRSKYRKKQRVGSLTSMKQLKLDKITKELEIEKKRRIEEKNISEPSLDESPYPVLDQGGTTPKRNLLMKEFDFDVIQEENSEESEDEEDYYEFESPINMKENGDKVKLESLIPYSRIKNKERKSKVIRDVVKENDSHIGCVNTCSLI